MANVTQWGLELAPVLMRTGYFQAAMFRYTKDSTLAAHFDSSQRVGLVMHVATFVFVKEFWVENASGFGPFKLPERVLNATLAFL